MPRDLKAEDVSRLKLGFVRGQCAAEFAWDGEKIEASAEGEKKLKKFSMTAYTGGPMRLGFGWPVVVDLAGMDIGSESLPILKDHDSTQIVGHTDGIDKSQKRLKLSGVVSGVGESAQEVIALGGNGFPWQASIGASVERMEFVDRGESVTVNGRSFQGPLYVARKSTLVESSFVAIGADTKTSSRVAASHSSQKGKDMEFEQWLEAKGFDPAVLNDDQKLALMAAHEVEIEAAKKPNKGAEHVAPPVSEFDADDIKAMASDHLANLEAIFAEHEDLVKADKVAEIRAAASKEAKELKVKALKEKWTATKYEGETIRAAAKVERNLAKESRPSGPAIHSRSRSIADNKVIEAAMCQTLNVPNHEEQYDDKTLEAAHSTFKGRIGLQQVVLMAASANGMDLAPGEKIHVGNIRQVLAHAFPRDINASFSTVSLPGIFSNVANKELLAGYMEEDQTWREISAIRTVTDFKQVTSYRMLDNMEYEELSPTGHIKHGTLGQESYTRQAKTYAKMFALTRTDIINDDLGALEDLRARLGRGSAKKFNNVFWAAFLNNSSFFTTARGNYITGATTNLDVDGVGLEAGVTAFRKLKSPSGDGEKRVGGRPSLLLVPPELEFVADRLYQSTNVNTGGSSTKSSVPNANIHAGKYRPVVCDWLSDSDFTGYSTTAWYLLRQISDLAPMVVSFLNGMQAPTVESADADFDQLGVQFRGYHDWGCDQAEYLAGVKSKGAA